jgi:hypothetical protein
MQVGELLDVLKDVPRDAEVQIDIVTEETDDSQTHRSAVAKTVCIFDDVPGKGWVVTLNGPSKWDARHRIEGIVNYLDR